MKTYSGIVTRRSGKASALGFPTINIPFSTASVSGIYAARVTVDGTIHNAAAFADPARGVLEAHLLDFSGVLDDKEVAITLVRKIRDNERFPDDDALSQAIAQDVAQVRYYLSMPQASSRFIRLAPWLVFIAAMLWATDAPLRLHLTQSLSSEFIVLAEHLVSVVIVLPLILTSLGTIRRLTLKQWLAIAAIAIGGSALASIAFTEAFHYVNPSVAILLQKLQPFIAISLAGLWLGERTGKRFWPYALLAIAGAYLISFPHLVPRTFPGEAFDPNLIGVGLALLAAVFWGASTVLGKYMLSSIDFKLMTALRFSLAFLFLLALAVSHKSIPDLATIPPTDYLYLVIIALVSGTVSLFIYYKGLAHTPASVATLAELGFPVAAVVVNWVFLDAILSPVQLIGIVVLLIALYRLSLRNNS